MQDNGELSNLTCDFAKSGSYMDLFVELHEKPLSVGHWLIQLSETGWREQEIVSDIACFFCNW